MKPLPPFLSLSIMTRRQINQMFLNPLHPIISMYILYTVLYSLFSIQGADKENLFNNLWLVIISFILVTLMVDSGVTL